MVVKSRTIDTKSTPLYRPAGVTDKQVLEIYVWNRSYARFPVTLHTPSGPIEILIQQVHYYFSSMGYTDDFIHIKFMVVIKNKSARHKFDIHQIYGWRLMDSNGRKWDKFAYRKKSFTRIYSTKYCLPQTQKQENIIFSNNLYGKLQDLPDRLILTVSCYYFPGGYRDKITRELTFEIIRNR